MGKQSSQSSPIRSTAPPSNQLLYALLWANFRPVFSSRPFSSRFPARPLVYALLWANSGQSLPLSSVRVRSNRFRYDLGLCALLWANFRLLWADPLLGLLLLSARFPSAEVSPATPSYGQISGQSIRLRPRPIPSVPLPLRPLMGKFPAIPTGLFYSTPINGMRPLMDKYSSRSYPVGCDPLPTFLPRYALLWANIPATRVLYYRFFLAPCQSDAPSYGQVSQPVCSTQLL